MSSHPPPFFPKRRKTLQMDETYQKRSRANERQRTVDQGRRNRPRLGAVRMQKALDGQEPAIRARWTCVSHHRVRAPGTHTKSPQWGGLCVMVWGGDSAPPWAPKQFLGVPSAPLRSSPQTTAWARLCQIPGKTQLGLTSRSRRPGDSTASLQTERGMSRCPAAA